ncbi:hypothetical protein E3U23_07550 [Erythrobacter litoralis]|uniref:hypothetical protein n=1 Tax=Erythrobacter litoralis TaxID=39960 RepID=UPI002434F0F5|nr:hypothetical protein [Erythrobacter litoralis]MDG6079045.1 hypothetical protein [Erythrobacter litoralis]
MKLPQMSAHLSDNDRQKVGAYADELGLDASGLLNLLIRRELRLKRNLKDVASISTNSGSAKVTAHRVPEKYQKAFRRHAKKAKLSVSAACRGILLREVDARELAQWVGMGDSA